MKGLIDNIKGIVVGLGLLALVSSPLEAQGTESHYLNKASKADSYCLSNRAKRHIHNIYSKSVNSENYCVLKKTKKLGNYTQGYRGNDNFSCVSKQAKRYNKHFNKEMRKG